MSTIDARIDAIPLWIGWARPNRRHKWKRIVADADERRAFNLLLDAVRGGDKIVLPSGVDPNDSRRP
jgi:hypothetical protein